MKLVLIWRRCIYWLDFLMLEDATVLERLLKTDNTKLSGEGKGICGELGVNMLKYIVVNSLRHNKDRQTNHFQDRR